MPTATRKKAARPAVTATRKKKVEAPVVSETPEAPVVDVDSVEDKPKRGRKPSPVTAPLKEYEKAHARAERARKKAASLKGVLQEVADAEAAEQEAWRVYQEAQSSVAPPPPPSS
ncbi:hypothetical protein [Streptomyces microflavus]|uniref:hypothetical protein n=1 Tax=Streptomyces microflavus TaxID=1919 RepID=UPI0036B3D9DA